MSERQLLILDDDPTFRAAVRDGVGGMLGVTEAGSEAEFRNLWRSRRFDLLLLDMRLRRDREGLDVLREVFAQDETQPVIMVSAYGDTESAIEAVGAGAMMFLHKREFSPALLGRMMEAVIEQGRLRRQVQALRRQAWAGEPDGLLGSSAGIREATDALRSAAQDRDSWPLVTAERGAGASLAARLIHRMGDLAEGPHLEVEAQVVEEASFFDGKFSPWVQSAGGTLAVDGVERLGKPVGKRFLESGDHESRNVVFLLHEVGRELGFVSGRSRKAEMPRWLVGVNTLPVRLPPLRERREDIPLLATHFLQRQRAGGHTTARSLSGAAMAKLESHVWPGNVRELRNAVEYAALQAAVTGRDEISPEHLPAGLALVGLAPRKSSAVETGWDYRLTLARAELELADRAIREKAIQQKTALAEALGYTDRFTFGRRVEKALRDFPFLDGEFDAVARMFGKSSSA